MFLLLAKKNFLLSVVENFGFASLGSSSDVAEDPYWIVGSAVAGAGSLRSRGALSSSLPEELWRSTDEALESSFTEPVVILMVGRASTSSFRAADALHTTRDLLLMVSGNGVG